MTNKEFIKANPINSGESKMDYFRRLADLWNSQNETVKTIDIFKKHYYEIQNKRKFVETARKLDKDGKVISTTEKLQQQNFVKASEDMEISRLSTNLTTGQQWVIETKKSKDRREFKLTKELIEQTVESLNLNPIITPKQKVKKSKALFVTYTDVHVGMDIVSPLYGGEWNAKELDKAADKIIQDTIDRYDKHETIYLDDLGDLVDGWNKETTRGGHSLPQNMTNTEAYQAASNFKLKIIIALSKLGCKIVCNNVVNDNHGGDFTHIVNIHVKSILSYLLPKVEYNIHTSFISHYTHDKYAFIITHGKDNKHLKYGFPLKPDRKATNHIVNYIDKHNLHGKTIIFKKGDTHIYLFDSSHNKFHYQNYPALSPASSWVQHNFTDGRRGFVIEEYKKDSKLCDFIEF